MNWTVSAQCRGQGDPTAGSEVIDGHSGTCLLKTSDLHNLPFYRRLGFTVEALVSAPGSPVWLMTAPVDR